MHTFARPRWSAFPLLVAGACAREPQRDATRPTTWNPAPPAYAPAPSPSPYGPAPALPTALTSAPAPASESAIAAPSEPAVPSGPSAGNPCFAADCNTCTARPGCGWCNYPRGCLPLDQHGACGSSNAWLSRAEWCAANAPSGGGATGLMPIGPPRIARLETVRTLEWPIRRGYCYELVVRLGPGAKLGQSVLYAEMKDTVQITNGSSVIVFGATPPVFGEPSCPRGAGTMSLKVKDVFDNFVNPKRGQGAIDVQLFSRPIAETTLQAREKDQDETYRRGMCQACRREYAACYFHGDTGCWDQFAECLRLNGLAPEQCE